MNGLGALVLGCALVFCADAQHTTSYKTTSVNGCIVEQPGPKYVLQDAKQMKVIAELEPVVFPVETFKKYLGKQVRLQGRLSAGNDPVVMRVRAIKALSGPCAPQPAAEPKTTTLSGCVDEQPGSKYVLRGEEKRELRAELEPVGFPVEHFARFLGHSVSILGQLASGQNPPLLRVQAVGDVKELSDQCVAR